MEKFRTHKERIDWLIQKTLDHLNICIFLMILTLQSNPAFAGYSRYYEEEEDLDPSSFGPTLLFLVGFGALNFVLFCLISKFFSSFKFPVWAAFFTSIALIFILPDGYRAIVISTIGSIVLLFWLVRACSALIIGPFIYCSFFSSICFLVELFTDQRIEYLQRFILLPAITFIFFISGLIKKPQ